MIKIIGIFMLLIDIFIGKLNSFSFLVLKNSLILCILLRMINFVQIGKEDLA